MKTKSHLSRCYPRFFVGDNNDKNMDSGQILVLVDLWKFKVLLGLRVTQRP